MQRAAISNYPSLEAAHILPYTRRGDENMVCFSECGAHCGVCLVGGDKVWPDCQMQEAVLGTIHDPKNGLLMRRDLHVKYDSFVFAINPGVRGSVLLQSTVRQLLLSLVSVARDCG
jgi:hypothetical protein